MARETASDAGPHGMKLPPEFGKVITLEVQCVYTAWSGQWMRGLGIDGAITLTVSTKTNTTDCRLGIKCRPRVKCRLQMAV